MKVDTTVRVAAYILRQNREGFHELLMFKHPDCPDAPIQIPGGGVEPQESLECALHREILEESGLGNLTILRKLGVAESCWLQPRKLISYRHCFLLRAEGDLPNIWDFRVRGSGIDSGMIFSYFWERPHLDFKLPQGFGDFLRPDRIPELYAR
ncbi:NUDIX domain-containing protein [Oscillatoria sp. FACHB-1406]|uniref:NUDIX domain-containing protein n=1 Tax=Oscillatoria sp. FACHB-1406 TaxID=2692846 RepID=UPI001686AB7D|nr:NUDIX domain-containing protein [Oscillatoria sp. FACHB-1406]MBD2579845.1 NUDIX domain-containing protein [Oscillatoria sp. FACHB-1406]